MGITMGIGTIEEALVVEQSIPEFDGSRTKSDYVERMGDKPQLILVARDGEVPIGYKVGYELEEGMFYSWLGGVQPTYRRLGVAQQLLEMQETWAYHHSYQQLFVKSMNRYPGMLILLIKNGYQIVDMEQKTGSSNVKIVFQKSLLP